MSDDLVKDKPPAKRKESHRNGEAPEALPPMKQDESRRTITHYEETRIWGLPYPPPEVIDLPNVE